MICSVPSGKSDSSWLDRLRSSKGFPVGNDLDFEEFINPNSDQGLPSDARVSDVVEEKNSSNPNSNSASMDTKSVAEVKKNPMNSSFRKHRKKEGLFNVMSNVLADLFNMEGQGGTKVSVEKKSCRKQPNPRICLFSASANVDDCPPLASVRKTDGVPPAMSPSSANNSVTQVRQRGKSASLTLVEEKSQTDLSSYSCVEVTIIDTSSSIWKSGKLIFRKGNVWKVRDKRWMSGNSTAFKKKRKASESDKNVGGKKKRKFSSDKKVGGGKKKRKLSLPQLNTSKEAGRKELTNPSNEVHQNAREELCKETPDTGSQVLKKRSRFSRSPRKPANSNSPVFHLQGISTSMKERGVHLPRSSLKDTC